MKRLITFLILLLQAANGLAQEIKVQSTQQDYLELKKFLAHQKRNPDIFATSINPSWNSKLFQQQFEEWLKTSRKKEPADAILVDSRHVIQSMPANYGIKDLMWISPAKKYSYRDSYEYMNASFGNQVAQDIINDVGSSVIKNIGKRKYHYRYSAADNNRSYQKPSFLQF